jgi:hypothetical protein
LKKENTMKLAVSIMASLIATGLQATASFAQTAPEPNPVCSSDVVKRQRFDLHIIGPLIEGVWTESALGMMPQMGLQTGPITFTYDRSANRLYMGESPNMVELRPNYGDVKPLRWDYLKARPLAPEDFATQLSLDDILLVAECESVVYAPQFTWVHTSGKYRSDGIISFLGPVTAMGVKWNNAMGAREQTILR